VKQPHREHVEALLREAAADRNRLIPRLPSELRESLPVDARGLTRVIDYLAITAGLSESERRALIRPHALNPAVLHARIFGPAPLARETVIASFVEGARVRADALAALADTVGGEPLGRKSAACSSRARLPLIRRRMQQSRSCAAPTRLRNTRR
jgi:hypothetical protein